MNNGFEHYAHMLSGDASWEKMLQSWSATQRLRAFAASMEARRNQGAAPLATASSYDVSQTISLFWDCRDSRASPIR
jgi:hypothetical protein